MLSRTGDTRLPTLVVVVAEGTATDLEDTAAVPEAMKAEATTILCLDSPLPSRTTVVIVDTMRIRVGMDSRRRRIRASQGLEDRLVSLGRGGVMGTTMVSMADGEQ